MSEMYENQWKFAKVGGTEFSPTQNDLHKICMIQLT